ncbi:MULTISPECIES: restriction endonuclease subunit S [Proteus]|uniref:restriction endonuclease subunit S n=1 Tax=Proteus TaxID=583 RepID=UPI001D035BB2|nr:restriction endonuclease subunit S [Proteus terrae]UDF25252.1 restriction endonuclease subunit S [Proteus terrae subsp. cibarius]
MSEWREVRLIDIAEVNPKESLSKGVLASKIGMEYLKPFCKKPIDKVAELYNGGTKFRNGDTLVARITPCLENGKTAFVDILDDGEIGFGSTEYIVLRAKNNISDSHYVYYFSRSDLFREIAIASMTGSSGRQRVQIDVVKNHLFELPDIFEQKAIASVLASLDNKIDLLHRQNKTLESMAETLFRQWFVEEAQNDWEEKTLADFGKVVCGKTPSKKKSEYYGNDIPFLKIPDMHGRVFISSTEDNLSLLGAESQLNKLLPEGSLCVSCIATVGLVCITSKPMQTNQQINSIIPKSSKYLYFLFLLMKSINDELHSLASGGTTTLNLNTGNFSKIKICVPPKEDIFSFNQSVYDFFEKIKSNTNQIQTLEKLRDTLLPKLMSGEVRVNYTTEEIKQ